MGGRADGRAGARECTWVGEAPGRVASRVRWETLFEAEVGGFAPAGPHDCSLPTPPQPPILVSVCVRLCAEMCVCVCVCAKVAAAAVSLPLLLAGADLVGGGGGGGVGRGGGGNYAANGHGGGVGGATDLAGGELVRLVAACAFFYHLQARRIQR